MDSVIEKTITLQLNKNWERIGYLTPRKAIVAMCGGIYGGTPPALGLPVEVDENGDFDIGIPLTWDEWVKLPVGPRDLGIAVKSGVVRCPTAIISSNYSGMPLIEPALTNQAIHERDRYVDQYTGKQLSKRDATVDHVIPKDVWKRKGMPGSPDCWENMVTCHREINSMKGNRLNHEVGLSLIRKPFKPKPVPKCFIINRALHVTHEPFLSK